MCDLAQFQATFAAGLLASEPPADLAYAARDADLPERYAVYRNNVVTALAGAVVKNHPVVERLVGAEFLRGAAVAFVRADPPRESDLTLAGQGFAEFLRAFPPARELPYLPDVARLDRAWLEALFSADASPLAAADLASLAPDEIAALAPGLAPGARVVASRFPAYTIWRACRDGDAAPIRLDAGAETALIWRASGPVRDSSVRHRRLSPGEAAFVQAIGQGATLNDAGAAALAADPEFDLSAAFAGLLAASALARPTQEISP
jgi:hypothetical protein